VSSCCVQSTHSAAISSTLARNRSLTCLRECPDTSLQSFFEQEGVPARKVILQLRQVQVSWYLMAGTVMALETMSLVVGVEQVWLVSSGAPVLIWWGHPILQVYTLPRRA
jgi:hypothetical protein